MKKIIIVDDEAFVLEQLCTVLNWNEIGFELVGSFPNAMTALEFIKNNEVNTVLTDIKMPHMDGLEFSRIVKEKNPNICVAIISAFRDFEYARLAMQYGIVDYITKPIVYNEFYNSMLKISARQTENDDIRSFSDTEKQTQYQQFFSNILCGITKDEEEIKENLSSLKINIDTKTSPVSIINVHINDFSNYLNTIWKHGKSRLYIAIGQLIPFEINNTYFLLIRYCLNNIEIIAVGKAKKEELTVDTDNFIVEFKQNLNDVLNINVDISVTKSYDSLFCIIEEIKKTKGSEKEVYNEIISSAVKYINEYYAQPLTLEEVSRFVNMSPVYFSAYFKQQTKENFINFLSNIRIEKAKELLLDKDIKISAVCNMVGYKNSTHFYNVFKSYNDNLTPAQYRDKYSK